LRYGEEEVRNMMAESCTEVVVAPKRVRIKRMRSTLKNLFVGSATNVLDPKTRVNNARKKIAEAKAYHSTLKARYPLERYPMERFFWRHKLFDALEVSYLDAEDATNRFEDKHL
jgi:hypothetical protein